MNRKITAKLKHDLAQITATFKIKYDRDLNQK